MLYFLCNGLFFDESYLEVYIKGGKYLIFFVRVNGFVRNYIKFDIFVFE